MKKKVILFYACIFILALVFLKNAVFSVENQFEYANLYYNKIEQNGLYYIPPGAGYDEGIFGVSQGENSISNSHDALISFCKNFSFYKDGIKLFDVRVLACVYSVLLILALGLIFYGIYSNVRKWTNFLFLGLFIFIFFDFTYLRYFNSFFVHPFIMLLLLNIFGTWYCMFRSQELKIYFYIPYLIFMFLLLTTFEPTAIFFVLILSLFGFSMWGYCRNNFKKVLLVLPLVLFFISSLTLSFTHKNYNYEENLYHAVFQGVGLHDNSIVSLGLGESLQQLSGTFYSKRNVDDYNLQEEFYSRIDYWSVGNFYIRNPKNLLSLLSYSANNGFNIDLPENGSSNDNQDYREKSAGFNLNLYSSIKSTLIPNTLSFVTLFILVFIYGVVLICNYNIRRGGRRGIIGILICKFVLYICALVCTPMFTGVYLIGFNNFMFYTIFDIIVITAVVGEVRFFLDRREHIKNDYGV